VNLSGQSFELIGSKTFVTNEKELVSTIRRPGRVSPPSASSVVGSVAQVLVPASAGLVAVRSAHATIQASMPDAATVAGAAQVRANPGDPTSLVLDFQGLRTVSEVTAPSGVAITGVHAWLGTRFDDTAVTTIEIPVRTVAFKELQTERLLVSLDSEVDPAAFAAAASVVLPTPPSDLELLVNGVRAWFRRGPIEGAQFATTIDLSAAVAAAVAAGPGAVTVTFRAAAPASLTLDCTAEILQRYPVVFPESAARTVDAPSEGVYPLLLPVQAAPSSKPWLVRQAIVDVAAKLPPTRVLPADGPSFSDDAELVLDTDHGIAVRLPAGALSSLGALAGVRLAVVAGADGAELAGTLRADAGGSPGDPIPKGALGPVTLEPSTATDAAWIDLALTSPHPLKSADVIWLELQAARGAVAWKLAPDDAAEAPLARRAPNGRYVGLSPLAGSLTGALRVVGVERTNNPLAAVIVAATAHTSSGTVAGVPTQTGTTLALVLDPPVSFAPDGSDFSLDLTISAPGSYAVSSAELQYTTQ
jgi:hypothetical protein